MFDDRYLLRLYNNVPVMNLTRSDIENFFQEAVEKGGYSIAINAEKLWMFDNGILKVSDFEASFNVADGVATVLAAKIEDSDSLVEKVNLPKLAVAYCVNNNLPLLIVGGTKKANDLAMKNLKNKFQYSGCVSGINGYLSDDEILSFVHSKTSTLNKAVILLGLGSPKQEKLARRIYTNNPNVFIVCCGGAINILAGTVRDAPHFVENSYFEWLFRFLLQPRSRLKRMNRLFWVAYQLFMRYFSRLRN